VDNINCLSPITWPANLDKSFGLLYSQRLLLALVQAGMLRDDAYASSSECHESLAREDVVSRVCSRPNGSHRKAAGG
jgi:adenylosuccinate lyase